MKSRLTLLFIVIAFFYSIFEASSQTIAVKSFRKLETDQEARIASPKTDQNGKKCAIIKVVTSQNGFIFDFGLIGNAVATEQKTAEIWVWVPAGARKVTISHQQLGILRNYPFDIDIEEATVYEMVLTTGKVVTTVEEQISSQWLVIKSEPSGADVYIDDQPANQTPYQNELPLGKHTYRISHDLYFPTAGSIVLNTDKKETLNLVLKPDFGTLIISTFPENGASVSIDGQPTGKVTPCTIEQVKSGEHTLTIRLNMYKMGTEKISMKAGENLNLPVTLAPTFADVTITTNPTSDIYIAGEQKGNGTWTGRLLPGIYLFEARKDKYTPISEKREVITGQPLRLTLEPVAQNGMLKVITDPIDAAITLNGIDKGTSPNTLRNLLVGDYNLILSLPNFATVNKIVTITEGQTTQVNEKLYNGKEVTINSDPLGATLTIDGRLVGKTPYIGNLTFGSHMISIEQGGKKIDKTISVLTGGESVFKLSVVPNIVGAKYQGGIIAYIFKLGDSGYIEGQTHGLIVAPRDQSDGAEWFNGRYKFIENTSTLLGTGKSNTKSIVSEEGNANYSAKLCNDLVIEGYDDWYLPSKEELYKLYISRKLIGGFMGVNYWSSSEDTKYNAWLQDFATGKQASYGKNWSAHTRAIRTF